MKIKFYDDNDNELDARIITQKLSKNKNYIYLIQPIMKEKDKPSIDAMANIYRRFVELGLDNVFIWPIANKSEKCIIQKIELDKKEK